MTVETNELRDRVRARYAAAAVEATKGTSCGCGPSCCGNGQREENCCGGDCCQAEASGEFGQLLYTAELALGQAG